MTIPNLLHPVPVTIARRIQGATIEDPVGRAPYLKVWREGQFPGADPGTVVQAQVNWNDGSMARPRRFNPSGVEEESTGYILLRYVDLVAAGLATEESNGTITNTIKRGDHITRIGRTAVNLHVLWFRDVAFYPDQGGATLLEIDFADRSPDSGGSV